MTSMADPMIALLKFQQAMENGPPLDPRKLEGSYLKMYDEPNGGKRYSYAKIVDGDVQAVSIFGLVDPVDGVGCYSIGYAVNKPYRGRGLAVEAVNKGIQDLKKRFSLTNIERFYIEAVIDITNSHSIRIAEQLFYSPGVSIQELESGQPALLFRRLIIVR